MQIKIDREKCINCGACATIAPKTFKLGDDNKIEVIEPAGDDEEIIKDAVSGCPVEAITIEE